MYENIRVAAREDIDLVLNMSMKFLDQTDYKEYLSENKIECLIEDFIDQPNSISNKKVILLNGEDGMLVGLVTPMLFVGPLVATELAWWVEPDKRKSNVGKELLDAFEYWAKKVGCKMITMVSLDDQVGKYYEKRGYKLYERSYLKAI